MFYSVDPPWDANLNQARAQPKPTLWAGLYILTSPGLAKPSPAQHITSHYGRVMSSQ